jgi:hypothetical protein
LDKEVDDEVGEVEEDADEVDEEVVPRTISGVKNGWFCRSIHVVSTFQEERIAFFPSVVAS